MCVRDAARGKERERGKRKIDRGAPGLPLSQVKERKSMRDDEREEKKSIAGPGPAAFAGEREKVSER